ncbi:MAG: hypothetical protein HRU23_09295 [Gammaproteobacteria bacterium]|nr:hypothetical protein [Gammaproteobacteria bacterium]
MKCSNKHSCAKDCDAKVAVQLSSWLEQGISIALKNSNVPADLTDKLSQLISNELDACQACEIVLQQVATDKAANIATQRPKGRVFDRAMVHMLELFYASVLARSKNGDKLMRAAPDFFNIVPRGECLDLFLQMIKRQCIGQSEVTIYTQRLESILRPYTEQGRVSWEQVYLDGDFATFLFDLFGLIFTHMKAGEYPVPALNNSLAAKHSPQRINNLLKHMLAVWQLQQQQDQTQ